uniref:Peptidoglycan-recognition protein n=1 Tax=Pyxicephalus adspersus TaxID=30357 RepID=A0AAV2ZPZ3_PYXAD|nr:TPA: hypothetical protein GDO54_017174 [Pyxicephalus adspersus]
MNFSLQLFSGCPPIISRSQWGSRGKPCGKNFLLPVPGVIIHHTAGASCNSKSSCSAQVRNIQNMHKNGNKWCDIGYNFLIGGDGSILEGRGWKTVGVHAANANSVNIGISFIGTFTSRAPSNAALNAAKRLISCGVAKGYIKKEYRLRGHRNVNKTECPGNSLYKIIKGWPRFRA